MSWQDTWTTEDGGLTFGKKGANWFLIDSNGEKIKVEGTTHKYNKDGVNRYAILKENQEYIISTRSGKDVNIISVDGDKVESKNSAIGELSTRKEVLEQLGVISKTDLYLEKIGFDRVDIELKRVGKD